MMMPAWLALLAPLPEGARPQRKPVASPELIASGQAGPIEGWESITVYLSSPSTGLRHVQITVDQRGALLSASDHVLRERQEPRGDIVMTIYDQENIGGRFEDDGAFRGTRWVTRTEQIGGDEQSATTTSTPSTPSPDDVAALRRLVDEVMARRDGASG